MITRTIQRGGIMGKSCRLEGKVDHGLGSRRSLPGPFCAVEHSAKEKPWGDFSADCPSQMQPWLP